MSAIWIRDPATNTLYSMDQIWTIGVSTADGINWSYTFTHDPASRPFYTSVTTFPAPLAALTAAYELLIIELT